MKRLFIFAGVFFSLIHLAFAQFDTSPSAQTGRLPFAAYSDGDIDSVSIYNGNVFLDFPLLALPGRELSTGMRLTYNSQKWQEFDFQGVPGGAYTGGWQANGNTLISESTAGRILEVTPEGSVVWEYVNPLRTVENGHELIASLGLTVSRYDSSYISFLGDQRNHEATQ